MSNLFLIFALISTWNPAV